MTTEKLEYFRGVLQEEMRALLGEAGKTVSEMTADTTNFPDPNDRATQESDRTFELRIRDRERRLINKIREALERIDDGTFGVWQVEPWRELARWKGAEAHEHGILFDPETRHQWCLSPCWKAAFRC
jgi:DnaK suppressor protein